MASALAIASSASPTSWSQLRCVRAGSTRRGSTRAVVSMDAARWVAFPKLSAAGKRLMETVADGMHRDLGDALLPSQTAPDVTSFQSGTGAGCVALRAGREGSKIDFVLGSWLSCALPFGELNIATLVAMLGPEADAPHLLFEFIQSGPGSLVLVLDLLPRRDLVLEPEYLARFYENPLEALRQSFEQHPHTQPYLTSALYVRSVVSPTALLYKVSGEGAEGGLDGVITELVAPAAVKVVQTWVDCYRNVGRDLARGEEMELMRKRDELIKSKGVEVDLSTNMPRLFGQEITDRVVAAFRKGV